MRKLISTALALAAITVALAGLAAAAPASEKAPATGKGLNLLLAGGPEDNLIQISLIENGRLYAISSTGALEVGGSVCSNPPGSPNELICQAPAIAGFEVNAGGGNDRIVIGREVPAPATLRGGPGNDELIGGAGANDLAQ